MDPDTSTSIPTDQHQPPVINYVLSFLLVGVAWGFTTPFIRRAAADFNARQDAKRNINRDSVRPGDGDGEEDEDDEGQELLGGEQDRNREDDDVDIDGGEGEGEGDNKSEDSNEQPANENEDSGRRTSPAQAQPQQRPAWLNPPQPRTTWVKNKLITLFWTIINLLRTPAYSIPLVINLTGSIWFFLLVGKHGMYLHPARYSFMPYSLYPLGNDDIADKTTSRTLPNRPPRQLKRIPLHRSRRMVR